MKEFTIEAVRELTRQRSVIVEAEKRACEIAMFEKGVEKAANNGQNICEIDIALSEDLVAKYRDMGFYINVEESRSFEYDSVTTIRWAI
jgi:hypothetical protein